MNFFGGQFFGGGFFGVNVAGSRPDDRYEWLKQCNNQKPFFTTAESNNKTRQCPPGLRWMK